MKYVVSGASGPIGIALVKLIVENGDQVIVLSSSSKSSYDFSQINSVKSYNCDLSSYKTFAPDFAADVFIHMAWVGGSARDDIYTNLSSVIASVDAVNLASKIGCHSFIGIGSQAEYGVTSELISPSSACFPTSPFGAAKLSSMHQCSFRCSQLGLRFAWARVFSVYGPHDRKTSLITSTLNSLIAQEPVAFTKADNLWDFLHVSDAAAAIYLLASNSIAIGVYNVASGICRPLYEYIDIICSEFGLESSPYLGLVEHSSSSVSLNADISRLSNEFDWSPLVEFRAGIVSLLEFQKMYSSC